MVELFGNQLKGEAALFKPSSCSPASGSAGWSCPSNIALIKYWGKRAVQLPLNPSLSMTLKESFTRTRLNYSFDPARSQPEILFRFEGNEIHYFSDRIAKYIRRIIPYMPILDYTRLEIESANTFPHSSGIASSASGLGALALCLVEMETQILGSIDPGLFSRKASYLARLGSGSACRSVFPGFALWGAYPGWKGSSDEFAIQVSGLHETFSQVRNTILIVESGQKKVSSSTGHELMHSNPYADLRFSQARDNLAHLRIAFQEGNWKGFIELIESEALSLHAMMMTSNPGYVLLKPGTLAIIHKVRQFRHETGVQIGFTLDAGANVHLLYPVSATQQVDDFVVTELVSFCENGRVIRDQLGNGPEKL